MTGQREVSVLILQYARPGSDDLVAIGVLVFDPLENSLHIRMKDTWQGFPEDDLDILEALTHEIHSMAQQVGASALVTYFEDTLSNTIRISERRNVFTDDPTLILRDTFTTAVSA